MPVGYEARCTKCGETFNPLPSDYHNGEPIFSLFPADLEHYYQDDGSQCGGQGELVGEWS